MGAVTALATALNTSAILRSQRGQSAQAAKDLQRAAKLCQTFLDEVPRNPTRIFLLCHTTSNHGQLLVSVGRLEEGLATLESCVEWMEFCAQERPDRSINLQQLMMSIASVAARLKGPAAAIPALERSRAFFQELLREDPRNARYESILMSAQSHLARRYADVGRFAEAIELNLDHLERNRKAIEADPENAGARMSRTNPLAQIAELLARQGKWEELLPYSREGLEITESLTQLDPENLRIREKQVQFLIQLGRAEWERARFEVSEQYLRRAMQDSEELLAMEPEYHSVQVLLYSARANFAQLCEHRARDADEHLELRLEWCRDALEHFRKAREQLEESRGDATVFGDREVMLSYLRRDEDRLLEFIAALQAAARDAGDGD